MVSRYRCTRNVRTIHKKFVLKNDYPTVKSDLYAPEMDIYEDLSGVICRVQGPGSRSHDHSGERPERPRDAGNHSRIEYGKCWNFVGVVRLNISYTAHLECRIDPIKFRPETLTVCVGTFWFYEPIRECTV